MSDAVRYIFKTLIKVPVFIAVAYLIFNIFAFTLTYFKMLGFSYVVMQTATQNNYLPDAERITLQNYLDSISNVYIIDDAKLILSGTEANESTLPANQKRQYGQSVTVGVQCHYKFIWPLQPKEQLQNEGEGFIGMSDNSAFSGFAGSDVLTARREEYEANPKNNIIIKYTVPGLKYYPDLG